MDDRRERNTGRSGRESGSKRKIFRRTVFLMLVCGVGLFIPLIGQLWNIAIVHHEEYQAEAVEQQTRDVEVAAFRGSIYDSSGDVLAMSATVYNLILSPRDLEASVDESKYKDEEGNADLTAYQAALQAKKDLVLDGVLAVLDLDREALADRLERTYSQYEVLKTNIEKEQAEQLRAFITENKLSHFLYLTPTTKRYYPYGDLAAHVLGFCNNIYNAEGGTHITGFKTTFTAVMNTYARELGILKEKDANFTGADIRNGMTAVISIKHPAPRFEGQTKTKLDNQDAAKATGKVTGDEIVRYFDRNLETLKIVLGSAEKAAKIRKTEERAKTNLLTKQKYSFDSNGKLANCESRDAKKCEIFIVEGDSAGGSAKTARNRQFQAILPIRGKILNVEKASIDKVLANAEIKTMINAFGCGFSEGYGNDFDITKLRYDKIVLMADADVDGAHICTLLLTLFYRFMPELIYEGHVYIAMPPLYKAIPSRGQEEYLYDDKALERYRKRHKGPFTLQRYKGLGEMDAQQLWETTLNPETRILKLVEIEDARMASEVTEMLMGTEVPPRRTFIYEHASDAQLDV